MQARQVLEALDSIGQLGQLPLAAIQEAVATVLNARAAGATKPVSNLQGKPRKR